MGSGLIARSSGWRKNHHLMKSHTFHRLSSVPAIVHIVLAQATRLRTEGAITQTTFDEQIRRISQEELTPRKLKLLVRELPAGRTRYIIKEQKTGAVCDLLNFDENGALEPDSAALLEVEAS